MERDGQLVRNRGGAYGIADRMDLVRGTVQAHRDGYGFLTPESGGDDLFCRPARCDRLSTVTVSWFDYLGRGTQAGVKPNS